MGLSSFLVQARARCLGLSFASCNNRTNHNPNTRQLIGAEKDVGIFFVLCNNNANERKRKKVPRVSPWDPIL
jgi:hypothetical protein